MSNEIMIERLRKVATITLIREDEDDLAEDFFENPDNARWAMESLESGNEWAWCQVEVQASYVGISASAYQNNCSYESEDDFKVPGGYYQDMVDHALENLAINLKRVANAVAALKGEDVLIWFARMLMVQDDGDDEDELRTLLYTDTRLNTIGAEIVGLYRDDAPSLQPSTLVAVAGNGVSFADIQAIADALNARDS